MFTSFLIKYAEIGIKGKNRYLFEDALVRQIKYALKKCEGEFLVHKTQGRIFVDAESEFDYDEVVAHLQRVFGISGGTDRDGDGGSDSRGDHANETRPVDCGRRTGGKKHQTAEPDNSEQ